MRKVISLVIILVMLVAVLLGGGCTRPSLPASMLPFRMAT